MASSQPAVPLDIRDRDNDIWILNLKADGVPRQLTYGSGADTNPVWLDNNRLVFTSNRSGRLALYSQTADGTGTAQPITVGGDGRFATTVTSDRTAVVGHQDGPSARDRSAVQRKRFDMRLVAARVVVADPADHHGTGADTLR